MELQPIKGKNTYCGPGAVAAITGLTTDESARALRRYCGKTAIKSTPPHALLSALQEFGYKVVPFASRVSDKTLGNWLNSTMLKSDRYYLVLVTNHLVVVSGDKIIDNWTKAPVSFKAFPHLRKKMVAVYEVFCGMGCSVFLRTFTDEKRIAANSAVNQARKVKRELEAVCKKYGLAEFSDQFDIWVTTSASRKSQKACVAMKDREGLTMAEAREALLWKLSDLGYRL